MIDPKLKGKSIYIWTLISLFGGDPVQIADACQAAGITCAWIKLHDGIVNYNVSADIPKIVAELRKRGIRVFGWGYIYLANPVAEADKAAERVLDFGLDGYVIDGEGEWKDHPNQADLFCRTLRSALPNKPLGLSSYRYIHLHPSFPWQVVHPYIDFVAPQVYWINAHNPAEQLIDCYAEYQAMMPELPFVPVGAAWSGDAWSVTPADIVSFFGACKDLDIDACSFWVMDKAIKIPAVWQAIASYQWPDSDTEPDDEPGCDLSEVLADLGLIKTALVNMNVTIETTGAKVIQILDIVSQPKPDPETDTIVGYVQVTRIEGHANGYIQVGVNGVGKPILDVPPQGERVQFTGRVGYYEKLNKDQVNGDNAFYRVTPKDLATMLYLHEKDVEEV